MGCPDGGSRGQCPMNGPEKGVVAPMDTGAVTVLPDVEPVRDVTLEDTLEDLVAQYLEAKAAVRAARDDLGRVEHALVGTLQAYGLRSARTSQASVALTDDWEWLPDAPALLQPALEFLLPAEREQLVQPVQSWRVDGHLAARLVRMGGQAREIVEAARVRKGQRLTVRAVAGAGQ